MSFIQRLAPAKVPWTRTTKLKPADYAKVAASADDESDLEKSSQETLLDKRGDFAAGLADSRRPARRWAWGFVHATVFVFYVGTLLVVQNSRPTCLRDVGLPYSPAVEILEFSSGKYTRMESNLEYTEIDSVYAGKPSPELDQAWHDLVNDENIKIEPEYFEALGRGETGVKDPDGSGMYLGTLNVYHEIHCLKRIHQYMYKEHYFPGLTEQQEEMNRVHNEHCIEYLRQAVMCHGDVGLMTFEWKDRALVPVANATSHQCINWDKLVEWTKARTVNMMKPGWLINPLRGVSPYGGAGSDYPSLNLGVDLSIGDNVDHLTGHGGHGEK